MSWRKNTGRDFHFDRPGTPCNVGPGSYNVDSGHPKAERPQSACFKNRETRSIFGVAKGKSPAPDVYNPSSTDHHIKMSSPFRTDSTRKVFTPTDNPAPCDHSNLLDWTPKVRERKRQEYILDRPYSPNVGQDVSGYAVMADGTLKPKKKRTRDPNWVGPGYYRPEDSLTYKKGHSLGDAYRNTDWMPKNDFPGPGSYDVTGAVTVTRPPSVPRYKRTRNVGAIGEDKSPKGGELKHKAWAPTREKMGHASFKSRSRRDLWHRSDDIPGPAEYHTQRERPKSAAMAAFGQRSPRFNYDDGNGVPGPGAYDTDNYRWRKSGPRTGRRARDNDKVGNGVPGPGAYEPNSDEWQAIPKKPNAAFASMSRREWGVGTDSPGPGTYNVPAPKLTAGVSMHHARSKYVNNFMACPYKDNPSPNQYQRIEPVSTRGRTISRDSRFERRRDDVPGPGAYEVQHDTLIKKSYNSELIGIGGK